MFHRPERDLPKTRIDKLPRRRNEIIGVRVKDVRRSLNSARSRSDARRECLLTHQFVRICRGTMNLLKICKTVLLILGFALVPGEPGGCCGVRSRAP